MRRTECEFLLKLLESRVNKYKHGLDQLRVKKGIAILQAEIWKIRKGGLSADTAKFFRLGQKKPKARRL